VSRLARLFIAIATAALSLPGAVAVAQAPALEPDDPSPATRHAQVIAHGVAPMPADEIAWRLTRDRAVPPNRADAEERPAGFILADKGVVALVDHEGRALARIAPGEAVWTEPGVARAVIGIERRAPNYYNIALVPATDLVEGDQVLIGGAPFIAPSGNAFDVDLIRDVLNRAEESVVSTGPSPALLLVTSGTVFVDSIGGLVEMTTGEAAQVAGDVVISGASRAPAEFVVARIGPEVTAPDTSEDSQPHGTPAPAATPGTAMETASVTISASLCPIAYAGGNDFADCATPASGVEFSLMSDDAAAASAQANDDGAISFTGIEPGHYTASAERPAAFATSRVRCRNASGDVLAAHTATNQIAMLLANGDELACTWYLVQVEPRDDTPPDSTTPSPTVTAVEEVDSDGDGLTDELETALGTDPLLVDSDADGVSDSDEIDFYGTDALDPDTDGDELDDAEELLTYGTNPLLGDTDGDDVSDGEEVVAGSDPLDTVSVPATPTPLPTSTPEPTLEPTSEPTPEATPALLATPLSTPDEAEESEPGQEPELRSLPPDDLDDDGLPTADEVSIYGTNVTVADSDGDGVRDGDEVAAGTDPLDQADN
jgi:Bacterial TSP3 repeat